ncbi:hypothetical protein PHMEG_0006153 [Phytophthora megakarya]|uniref:Uncharacterized protein n=1 Tax=Phytophthora megakarya TaxID=4795 RepID=A0A225WPT8_9STRA|nr:hypothetical protein PHMEG_0006153 [Phytophthora megakarya]
MITEKGNYLSDTSHPLLSSRIDSSTYVNPITDNLRGASQSPSPKTLADVIRHLKADLDDDGSVEEIGIVSSTREFIRRIIEAIHNKVDES